MNNQDKIILSLCDLTGTWSQPYAEAGYEVHRFDVQRDPAEDIRLIRVDDFPAERVHGIIAQPPCTHFAASGARWWADKGEEALIEGLQLVDACIRLIHVFDPEWWVLENPVGRLIHFLGPHRMTFQPHEYAGWADEPEEEAYTKRTCLWGTFNAPETDGREPTLGSKFHLTPPGPERARIRSATPQGFARAFFHANR